MRMTQIQTQRILDMLAGKNMRDAMTTVAEIMSESISSTVLSISSIKSVQCDPTSVRIVGMHTSDTSSDTHTSMAIYVDRRQFRVSMTYADYYGFRWLSRLQNFFPLSL